MSCVGGSCSPVVLQYIARSSTTVPRPGRVDARREIGPPRLGTDWMLKSPVGSPVAVPTLKKSRSLLLPMSQTDWLAAKVATGASVPPLSGAAETVDPGPL